MPLLRQPSLAGGELAPTMWGRYDVAKYAIGARLLRNFLVTIHGAAANRPGLRYVAGTKGNGKAVLFPFVFSDEDALILAFTDLAIRFYKRDPVTGLPGVIESAPGVPLEVVTPYIEADLDRLRTAQVGDVITLVHPKYAPRELIRSGPLTWALNVITFTFAQGFDSAPDFVNPLTIDQTGDPASGRTAKEWDWMVTWIDGDGNESLPSPPLRPKATTDAKSRKITLYSDRPISIMAHRPAGAVALNVYRGRNGIMGWVGQTSSIYESAVGSDYFTFRDDGDKPNYARRPPLGTSRYDIAGTRALMAPESLAFTVRGRTSYTPVVAGEVRFYTSGGVTRVYECIEAGVTGAELAGPAGVGVVEDGAEPWQPATVYAAGDVVTVNSATYYCTVGGTSGAGPGPNHGYGPVLGMAEAYPDNVAGQPKWGWIGNGAKVKWRYLHDVPMKRRYPSVVAFFEGRRVFANTEEAPDSIFFSRVDRYSDFDAYPDSGDAGPIQTAIAARRFEEVRWLLPRAQLIVGTSASEWTLAGSGQAETIAPGAVAAHPGTEHGSSWVPPLVVGTSIAFVQRKGSLPIAMVFSSDAGGYGTTDLSIFSRHLFDGRKVAWWCYAEDPWSLIYVGFDDGEVAVATYVPGQEILAWTRLETDGFVEHGCSIPEGDEDAVYLVVRRTVQGVEQRFIERLDTRKVLDAKEGVFLDAALTYRGAPVSHITGLDHLEGRAVVALADGNVVRTAEDGSPLVVTGGAIDLPLEAEVVHVGLPYVSDLELLDVAPGEGRNRVSLVKAVGIRVQASRGGYVGEKLPANDSTEGLEEVALRTVEDGYGPLALADGEWTVPVSSSWNVGGRAVVRHIDPLPLTILSVTRDVEVGG